MNKILERDILEIVERCSEFREKFFHKTFLITGATGLVGSILVRALLRMNNDFGADIKIVITTRNKEKARATFSDERIVIVQNNESVDRKVDFIVHCAAPTQPKFFVEKPVETMDAVVSETRRLLEIAKELNVERFLYVSSMEAYGTILEKQTVSENDLGFISLNSVRSSYSEGKRASELYTYCFGKEYGLSTISARLAMCFGSGVKKDDNRVCKSFCEDALAGRDILVKSTGETVVNYVYVTDAVVALLTLLARGENGEVYNVAGNNDNGMTIMDMAKMVAEMGKVEVRHEVAESGFAPDNKMVLSNEKMRKLGWEPEYDLNCALGRLYRYLEMKQVN